AVFLVKLEHDLGVAGGEEPPAARFEAGAQLDMVEHLAIIRDVQRAVAIGHGLRAVVREVDDGKAPMREPELRARMDAFAVRPAMGKRRAHALQQSACLVLPQMAAIAGYAAHGKCPGRVSWADRSASTKSRFPAESRTWLANSAPLNGIRALIRH